MRFSNVYYEFEFSTGVWTNIASLVIGNVKLSSGFIDWSPLDRVAGTGQVSFTIRNINNAYTPGHANCTSGFERGVPFRLRLTYDGVTRTRFYGLVEDIAPVFNPILMVTKVTVYDYMNQLAIHEIEPTFVEDVGFEEVVEDIIDLMPLQPLSTDYNAGQSTFATAFDVTPEKSLAMQELNKVALSELGFVYVTPSSASDEVLVCDGRYTRSTKAVAIVDSASIHFDNTMQDVMYAHGKHFYNSVKTITYPRVVDDSPAVLFNLDRSIEIPAGDTVTYSARYRDPNQESQSVSGIDMITPVATTDYEFYANYDGSGTDMTADLSVTATYKANSVEYELENTSSTLGYVTKLQARGYGVYTYNQVEFIKESDTEFATIGKKQLSMDLLYQDNPNVGKAFANGLLTIFNSRRLVLEAMSFVANRSDFLMHAFLELYVGDKIKVSADTIGEADTYYIIRSIDATFAPGALVQVVYGLLPLDILPGDDYWQLGVVGKSELGLTTKVAF